MLQLSQSAEELLLRFRYEPTYSALQALDAELDVQRFLLQQLPSADAAPALREAGCKFLNKALSEGLLWTELFDCLCARAAQPLHAPFPGVAAQPPLFRAEAPAVGVLMLALTSQTFVHSVETHCFLPVALFIFLAISADCCADGVADVLLEVIEQVEHSALLDQFSALLALLAEPSDYFSRRLNCGVALAPDVPLGFAAANRPADSGLMAVLGSRFLDNALLPLAAAAPVEPCAVRRLQLALFFGCFPAGAAARAGVRAASLAVLRSEDFVASIAVFHLFLEFLHAPIRLHFAAAWLELLAAAFSEAPALCAAAQSAGFADECDTVCNSAWLAAWFATPAAARASLRPHRATFCAFLRAPASVKRGAGHLLARALGDPAAGEELARSCAQVATFEFVCRILSTELETLPEAPCFLQLLNAREAYASRAQPQPARVVETAASKPPSAASALTQQQRAQLVALVAEGVLAAPALSDEFASVCAAFLQQECAAAPGVCVLARVDSTVLRKLQAATTAPAAVRWLTKTIQERAKSESKRAATPAVAAATA